MQLPNLGSVEEALDVPDESIDAEALVLRVREIRYVLAQFLRMFYESANGERRQDAGALLNDLRELAMDARSPVECRAELARALFASMNGFEKTFVPQEATLDEMRALNRGSDAPVEVFAYLAWALQRTRGASQLAPAEEFQLREEMTRLIGQGELRLQDHTSVPTFSGDVQAKRNESLECMGNLLKDLSKIIHLAPAEL